MLPPVATKLRVRSNHGTVVDGNWRIEPLAEVELTPKEGSTNRIDIEVPTPTKADGK